MKNIMVCAGEQVELSGAPTEIKILPLGKVSSQKGDFTVDNESFELIQKHFQDRKIDLVIDYEHQTLHDTQAPAGGWIKELYKGTDAIMAKVEWTPRAAEYLKNKEYRYLSPVVIVRKKDEKAMALHSLALTNTPAINGMFTIANSFDIEDVEEFERNQGGSKMDFAKIKSLLGLPETATEADLEKAVEEAAKAKEAKKEEKPGEGDTGGSAAVEVVANSTILSLLGIKEDAKTEEVAAAIMTLKAGDADVAAEVKMLKEELQERKADELVKAALKAGKITAAQKEWAKGYALKDADGFKSFSDKAPQVVPMGKIDLLDAPGENKAEDISIEILKATGMTEDDIKKYAKLEG